MRSSWKFALKLSKAFILERNRILFIGLHFINIHVRDWFACPCWVADLVYIFFIKRNAHFLCGMLQFAGDTLSSSPALKRWLSVDAVQSHREKGPPPATQRGVIQQPVNDAGLWKQAWFLFWHSRDTFCESVTNKQTRLPLTSCWATSIITEEATGLYGLFKYLFSAM